MSTRLSVYIAVTAIVTGLLIVACGSGSDSTFGNGASSGGNNGPGSSSGILGGGGDGGSGEASKPCTGLCLRQKACAGGATTSLSGKVFDPAGKVPLYNVIVYVPNAPVAALTSGASCDRCGDVSGDPLVSAITDTSGHFKLTNVPVGPNVPVVIQVGKWRRQITIDSVAECADTAVAADQSRLPKNHTEGDIPLMPTVPT